MKKTKRLWALLLALVLTLSLSVTASATTSIPGDNDEVTVYFTQGAFTPGGIDGYQVYSAGNSPSPSYYYLDVVGTGEVTLTIAQIRQYMDRSVYNTSYTGELNVLDAIIAALKSKNSTISITGGWDDYSEPNGGYISSAGNVGPSYGPTRTQTENGITYTVYTGSGFNIACTQGSTVSALDLYGTNYSLTADMTIVFDYSPYEIYWANN